MAQSRKKGLKVVSSIREKLPDIQKTKMNDTPIPQVGEENIDFLFKIYKKNRSEAVTTASKVDFFHWLSGDRKGINMSRIMEVLMEFKDIPLDKRSIKTLLIKMIETMERKKSHEKKILVKDVFIRIKFPFFIEKKAPVSKKIGLVGYDCAYTGKLLRINRDKFVYIFAIEIAVPVTSLCPCSKEISKYGAHNQRSKIIITVQLSPYKTVWIEDLIKIVENQGSCEIFSLLKREDEKAVTETAYENPNFVEDIIRNTRRALEKINEIKRFKIGVKNYESIHTHDAAAYIRRYRKGKSWFTPYKIGLV